MTTTADAQVFVLPDLGEGLTEAEVVRWLVAVGDEVVVDQPVVEVETAKSIVEVPSPYAGVVATLHGAPGEAVAVGAPLITIGGALGHGGHTGGEEALEESTTAVAAVTYREEERAGSGHVLIGYGTTGTNETGGRRRRRRPGSTTAVSGPPAPQPPSAPTTPRRVVSPLVRRLARDGGVDLADVVATGEGGTITRDDVVRALAPRDEPGPRPADRSNETEGRRTPLNGFRKAVAASLSRSRAQIPEATVWVDVVAPPAPRGVRPTNFGFAGSVTSTMISSWPPMRPMLAPLGPIVACPRSLPMSTKRWIEPSASLRSPRVIASFSKTALTSLPTSFGARGSLTSTTETESTPET